MKEYAKKAAAVLLAGTMLLGAVSGCTQDTPTGSGSPAPTGTGGQSTGLEYPVTPEELGSGEVKWSEEKTDDGWMKVTNTDGSTLGYSPDSGVSLIQVDGYAFKDLNKNGQLDAYEDWRLDANTRAADLASQMSADEIIPLMTVTMEVLMTGGTTGELTDEQKAILDEGKMNVQGGSTSNMRSTTTWVNGAQAYAEAKTYGIPVMLFSDPFTSGTENVPNFPSNLAIGATFDPSIAEELGTYLSQIYRAVGIGTLLGPQIDISTEPRWNRVQGTFSEDPALSRDMANASVNGHQSTYDEDGNDLGWGVDSVNAMVKHWPGDGAAQFGRESHDATGKYTVYPGDNFDAHLIAFVDGALNLDGATESATAVMPSYSIAWSEDESLGELVGSSYSEYKIQLLRSYGFDGVVCTDWEIITDPPTEGGESGPGHMGRPWGVESSTIAERAYKCLVAGVDQFGCQSDLTPLREAYQMLVDDEGEEAALAQIRESGRRLLRNTFIIGLFENAYLDTQASIETLNNEDAAAAARDAQTKSVVMLKNDGAISAAQDGEKPTVYVPLVYTAATTNMFGTVPASAELPIDRAVLEEYFNVVTDTISETLTGPADENGNPTLAYEDIVRATPDELAGCDYACVFAQMPVSTALQGQDADGNEVYLPISLQYSDYTADSDSVRKESIAGDMVEVEIETPYGIQKDKTKENVAYYGNSNSVSNKTDLDMILYAAENMPESAKVIVCENGSNAMVFSEFEDKVDAILVGFGIDDDVFLDIVTGKVEPSGLLPIQMPASMEAVEAQYEDVPRDMECYVDAAGNTYDFGFGLNWSGVIQDERTEKYCVEALTEPVAQPVDSEG